MIVQRRTLLRLRTDTSISCGCVGMVRSTSIRDSRPENVHIKKVINNVHPAVSGGAWGTIDAAV